MVPAPTASLGDRCRWVKAGESSRARGQRGTHNESSPSVHPGTGSNDIIAAACAELCQRRFGGRLPWAEPPWIRNPIVLAGSEVVELQEETKQTAGPILATDSTMLARLAKMMPSSLIVCGFVACGGSAEVSNETGSTETGATSDHGDSGDDVSGTGGEQASSGGGDQSGSGGQWEYFPGSGGYFGLGTGGEYEDFRGSGGLVDNPPSVPCPETVPEDGATACLLNGQTCFYRDCVGAGESRAVCEGGVFSVETVACGENLCVGIPCAENEVCSIVASGAYLVECSAHSCGTGPITCACAGAECGDSCEITGSPGYGVSVRCTHSCGELGCP